MITTATLLTHLSGVTGHGPQWWALCPCHPDRSPSLSVREADDGAAMARCFSCGAVTADVLRTLDLLGQSSPTPPPVASDDWRDHLPRARTEILHRARGQAWYRHTDDLMLAESLRHARRTVERLHRAAEALPPDLDVTWELLASAQRITDAIRNAEDALDHSR